MAVTAKNIPPFMKSPTQTEAKAIEMSIEEIAAAVKQLSTVGQLLAKSRLKQKTILILLQHYTKLPHQDIKKVLEALLQLEREYLK